MSDFVTYVSFAEPGKCLGVLILNGDLDVIEAAKTAYALGLNPGGQVMAITAHHDDKDIPPGMFEIMLANTNRLIPAEEARNLFDARSIREFCKEN